MKPFQKYASDGYFVARGAIPQPLVNNLAAVFSDKVKTCTDPLLRQSRKVEPHNFDAAGFMTEALVNPHANLNPKLIAFRLAILDLACSGEMLRALQDVTLWPKHGLYQVMIFEQSTTPPHQDWYYLDSCPPGCMTAAWAALEDIDPEATRFFVVPGSQDFERAFPEDSIFGSENRYMNEMIEIFNKQYADNVVIPEMKDGDVLFWNSRLIHGSLTGTNLNRSRLSLTAHYIPGALDMAPAISPTSSPTPTSWLKEDRFRIASATRQRRQDLSDAQGWISINKINLGGVGSLLPAPD
jgi:phytanoyl-CoA hydroxylase